MLHLAGRIGIGGDVGDLLQLQRALQADGQADVPAEIEKEAALVMRLGDCLDGLVHDLDRLLDLRGDVLELRDQLGPALLRHRPAQLGEAQAEQVHHGDLADEGLGRGDPDFQARAGEQDGVGVARGLAAHHVRYGQHLRPPFAGQAHGGQSVCRLAGLRDADDQVVLAQDRFAVAVLGGNVHLDRDARPLLDRVAAHEARVVARPAGDDDDAVDVPQILVVELDIGEIDSVKAGQPICDRLGDGVGLLVDLLHHEGGPTALLGGVLVPGDLLVVAGHRVPPGVRDLGALGGDRDQLAVLDLQNAAGLGQEGWDRRSDEGLVVAQADDQRALFAGRDQHVGLVGVHCDERIVPAQLAESGAHGLRQVAVEVALDQVADDLGVGLGAEHVAVLGQFLAQLAVVLDDAVQDDVDLVAAVAVGVRVLLGHAAVRRPAGVCHADRGGRRANRHVAGAVGARMLLDRRAKVREVADSPDAVDLAVRNHRDPRRVVTTVLELLEPGDQQVPARSVTHVSDYAAHKRRDRLAAAT